MNLVHGDLKGVRRTPLKIPSLNSLHIDLQANILINSHNPVRACLADFGFMTIAYDNAGGPEGTLVPRERTAPFMAPELSTLEGTKHQVSRETDVYAFGMVILQVRPYLRKYQIIC